MDCQELDDFEKSTTLVNIDTIFNKNRKFIVPIYQRGYAWDKNNVEDLWKDIHSTLNGKVVHYMGMLSVTQNNENKNIYEIVDGQQRMTTILILLSLLNNRLNENLQTKFIKDKDDNFCFTYQEENQDRKFFEEQILTNQEELIPTNIYQKNLLQTKNYMHDKLQNLSNESCKDILDCILHNLQFNIYCNPDSSSAKMMFETMNNRGKILSKLEILKNRLMYLVSKTGNEKLLTKIFNTWNNIYQELGQSNDKMLKDDEFLKAHWLVYGKKSGNMKEKGDSYARNILDEYFAEYIYNEETDDYDKNNITLDDIEKYVNDLNKSVKYWAAIKNPYKHNASLNLSEDEKKYLDKLSRIRNMEFVNVLLFASLYSKSRIDTFKRLELYKTLEKFIFINYSIPSGKRVNDMSFCVSVASNIYSFKDKLPDNVNIDEYILEYNNKQIDAMINNLLYGHNNSISKKLEEQLENLKGSMLRFFEKFKGKDYFLYEYNLSLLEQIKGNETTKLLTLRSVEHILPQKPKKDSSWTTVLKNYTKEESDIIKHSIGNLVLVSGMRNSEFGRKGYKIKKEFKKTEIETKNNVKFLDCCYASGTQAEVEIANNNKYWTIKNIYNRCKKLLEFLFNNWIIPAADLVAPKITKEYNDNKDKFIESFIPFTVHEDESQQELLEKELENLYQKEFEDEQERIDKIK